MSVVTNGGTVPEAGNLLTLHGVGFHGLQAIPLLALLMNWSGTPEPSTRRTVHIAGLAWLGACLAMAWQSGTGHAIAEMAPATLLAAALLATWLVFALAVTGRWLTTEGQTGRRADGQWAGYPGRRQASFSQFFVAIVS